MGNVDLFLRESMSGGGAEREGDRGSKTDPVLSAKTPMWSQLILTHTLGQSVFSGLWFLHNKTSLCRTSERVRYDVYVTAGIREALKTSNAFYC